MWRISGRLRQNAERTQSLIYDQKDSRVGSQHGCSQPPQLRNRLPFGIDWIRKLWRSDSEQHLLAFLCSIADGYEPRNMLSQYLMSSLCAYHILDPANLETVLSTKSEGTPEIALVLFFTLSNARSAPRLWVWSTAWCVFTPTGPRHIHPGGCSLEAFEGAPMEAIRPNAV